MNKLKKIIRLVMVLCMVSCVMPVSADMPQKKARKQVAKTSTKKKRTTNQNKKQKAEPVFVPTAQEEPDASIVNEKWKVGEICLLCENNPGLCPYCNGSGKKMLVTNEGTSYVKCDKCSGNGICPTCKGKTAKVFDPPKN
jgi:DnaJ-class molecular chaperone